MDYLDLTTTKKEAIRSLYFEATHTLPSIASQVRVPIKAVKQYLVANDLLKIKTKVKVVNSTYFDEIDTQNKAYFLGLLFADGSLNLDRAMLRLALKVEDTYIIKRFRNDIAPSAEVKLMNLQKRRDSGVTVSDQSYLNLNDVHLCSVVNSYGLTPKKSLTVKFPSSEIVPNDLVHHFVRGFFDGNGNIHPTSPAVNFASVSSFLLPLQELLCSNIDIGKTKLIDTHKGEGLCRAYTIAGFNQVMRVYDWMYKDASLYLTRKKEIFDSIRETRFLKLQEKLSKL